MSEIELEPNETVTKNETHETVKKRSCIHAVKSKVCLNQVRCVSMCLCHGVGMLLVGNVWVKIGLTNSD